MSEKDVIERTPSPVTVDTLVSDLKRIGVDKGCLLLVQSSLSSIGWVCGGAVAVIVSLMKTMGEDGKKIRMNTMNMGIIQIGMIGNAKSYFFRQNDIVKFGIEWLERNMD